MAEVEVFKIDIQPVVSELAKLGSELEKARANYQETKKAQGEYSEDAIRAKSEVNVLSKEVNALTNVLTNQQKGLGELDKAAKANIDITKLQGNTIETNRKLYNALYNQQLRNPSEQVAKQVKALSDTLKEQEKQLGDTRRNVGNYSEGFKDAFDAITETIPGLKGFDSAQKGINMTLAANPIGGVITLLFALKEIFGQNAVVADQLSFAFEALNKGFSFIIDTIVETVTNFDKLAEAVKNPIKFIKDLTVGTAEATKAGYESAQAYDVLTEAIGEAGVALEKNNVLIEKERTILMNKKKSDAERLQAAKEIIRLETENANTRIKIAEDEVKAEKLRLKNSTLSADDKKKLAQLEANVIREQANQESAIRKAQIETDKILFGDREELSKESAAKRKAIQDAEIAEQKRYLDNLEKLNDEFLLSEREKLNKSFQDKLDTIIGQSDSEIALREAIAKKQSDALIKFDEDAEKKRQDNQKRIESEIIASNAKSFNDAIAANKRKLDLDLEAVDLSVATEEQKAERKRMIQLESLQAQLELTRKFVGPAGSATQEELDGIKKIENAIERAKQSATQKPEGNATFASAIGIDEEQLKAAAKGLGEAQQAVSAISNAINAGYELRLQEIENAKNAEIQAIEQSGLSAEEKEKKIAEINKKAAKEEYEIQKKQFEVNKAIQIVQTIIAGALGVVSAFQLGPIAGAIAAAAIAVTTGVQVALIAAQKPPPPPKFATGVIGLEGAGTATSDSIDAKLSRGESVMTAKATERFAPILAQMELAVGNRPNFQMGNKRFATGFIPIGDGGYSTRNAASDLMAANASEKAMMQAVAAMPAQKLVLEEFRNFETNVDKSVAISEL
jgi:hypothetical protein